MWMIVGMAHSSNRIAMDSLKHYTVDDLVQRCTRSSWPFPSVYLEYSPGYYMRVRGETELRFACELVSRYHAEVCNVHVTYGSNTCHLPAGFGSMFSSKDAAMPPISKYGVLCGNASGACLLPKECDSVVINVESGSSGTTRLAVTEEEAVVFV